MSQSFLHLLDCWCRYQYHGVKNQKDEMILIPWHQFEEMTLKHCNNWCPGQVSVDVSYQDVEPCNSICPRKRIAILKYRYGTMSHNSKNNHPCNHNPESQLMYQSPSRYIPSKKNSYGYINTNKLIWDYHQKFYLVSLVLVDLN